MPRKKWKKIREITARRPCVEVLAWKVKKYGHRCSVEDLCKETSSHLIIGKVTVPPKLQYGITKLYFIEALPDRFGAEYSAVVFDSIGEELYEANLNAGDYVMFKGAVVQPQFPDRHPVLYINDGRNLEEYIYFMRNKLL